VKIVVLAGGLSPEREVSLCSGGLIANALTERGHRVLLLDVYEGMAELPADPEALFPKNGRYSHPISEEVPDPEELKKRVENGNALIGPNVETLCRMADRVLLALHGSMGENGQLQAYLDVCGIRYTGSGYDGCCYAMDKDVAKRLLASVGVPTPAWVCVDPTSPQAMEAARRAVGFPCVVKPCDGGSSVGVSMANTEAELREALELAGQWCRRVLVEKRIVGREFTVGILGDKVLPPVEILPDEGFYDYRNKYRGTTKEICPARLPQETVDRLSDLTKLGFDVLRLKHYARFDYLMDERNELWCLEANALPGMTPASLLPLEAAAVGISYGELCERILQLSYEE